jgi:methionyl-tRNA synthetase
MGIAADERDLAALLDTGWYDRLRGSGFTLGAPVPIFPRLEFAEDVA